MKQAIQFGAGNIGRGFIGALLSRAGYHVVFADVNTEMIDALNHEGRYTVFITDDESETIPVDHISALHTSDPVLITKICESEVITTAVGLGILPRVAPVIATGLEERATRVVQAPLNIIACENGVCASTTLKKEVFELLSPSAKRYCDEWVGFVDCSVDRIVPPFQTKNLTDVCVERFYEWNVDRTQIKGELRIDGMNEVTNLPAYVERKLFTLNTGHSITAYLGYRKGYETIEQSIADSDILAVVRAAMHESGAALVQKFGLDTAEHASYCDKILQRFRNPYLQDAVTRVGREPLRKLSANDRLILPLTTAYDYGLPIDNLLLGIGAALHYHYPADAESNQLQELINEWGVPAAVEKITGIAIGSPLNKQIVTAYHHLETLLTYTR